MNYVKECASCSDIVECLCIRMTWWVPAAVPQMMKLMKHTDTVICSLLMYWRLSTWLGEHLFVILQLVRYQHIIHMVTCELCVANNITGSTVIVLF